MIMLISDVLIIYSIYTQPVDIRTSDLKF
jgi:hypothetical protein